MTQGILSMQVYDKRKIDQKNKKGINFNFLYHIHYRLPGTQVCIPNSCIPDENLKFLNLHAKIHTEMLNI